MEWTTNMEGGGTLYFRDDGTYYYFEANYPTRQEGGEYQVILQGVQGGQLLGTMTACETGWKLSRMVSRTALEKWGCLPVTKVICQKHYPFIHGSGAKENSLSKEINVKENYLPDYGTENEISSKEQRVEWWKNGENEKGAEKNMVINGINTKNTAELTGKDLIIGEKEEGDNVAESIGKQENRTENREEWLPVTWGEEKNENGFSPCPQPWKEVESSVISSLLRHCTGVLRREEKEGFTLAIPYYTDKEFPLTPVFCFGVLETWAGGNYLKFSFSKEGKPVSNTLA